MRKYGNVSRKIQTNQIFFVMKTQIHVYIGFNGRCREAMTFYQSCLGGELFFQTFKEAPPEMKLPKELGDSIIHSSIKKGDLLLMASDMSRPGEVKGNNISLSLACATESEINEYFERLSAGGKVVEPLNKQFWGDTFGVVEDKFGISWMLNHTPD
jgi:PhnB protein